MPITANDGATKRLELPITTESRAQDGDPGVEVETRGRVATSAQDIFSFPNQDARRMRWLPDPPQV